MAKKMDNVLENLNNNTNVIFDYEAKYFVYIEEEDFDDSTEGFVYVVIGHLNDQE